jgi:hypothetical protein
MTQDMVEKLNKCFDLVTAGSTALARPADEEPVGVLDGAEDAGDKSKYWAQANWLSLLRTGTMGAKHGRIVDEDDEDPASETAREARQCRKLKCPR